MRKDLFYTINTKENYELGLKSGMFWVYWPELSGEWEKDSLIINKTA